MNRNGLIISNLAKQTAIQPLPGIRYAQRLVLASVFTTSRAATATVVMATPEVIKLTPTLQLLLRALRLPLNDLFVEGCLLACGPVLHSGLGRFNRGTICIEACP